MHKPWRSSFKLSIILASLCTYELLHLSTPDSLTPPPPPPHKKQKSNSNKKQKRAGRQDIKKLIVSIGG